MNTNWQNFIGGGLSALIDSQGGASGVNDPTPYTQDGKAGTSQVTSFAQALNSPIVIGGAVLLGVLILVMVIKK